MGPALNRVLVHSFGHLSRRFVASLGTRLALAEHGAVAGTVVQPVGGQVVGAAVGVLVGAAADYLGNEANEAFNREEFVAANEKALDATIAAWKAKPEGQYRHRHRQMVRRRALERRAHLQIAGAVLGLLAPQSRLFTVATLISVAFPALRGMLGLRA